jgi:hypothetical protein
MIAEFGVIRPRSPGHLMIPSIRRLHWLGVEPTGLDDAAPGDQPDAVHREHDGARRVAARVGWVALGLLLAVAITRLGKQVPLNSDQASSALEGWALAHGNLMLSGWTLPADSFFTSKLPLLALLERVQGLTPDVVSEASGLLGAGIVLAAVWLAGGRYRGGTRALVMLVTGTLLTAQTVLIPGGANSFPAGQMLPAGSDHAATLLLLLIAYLALQGVRGSRVWWVIVWLALAVASVGDPLAIVVGGGSIIVVAGLDLAVRRREGTGRNAALIVVGLTSALAIPLSWWGIRQLGGFTAAPLLGSGYGFPAPVSSLSHNLSVGGRALLTVFGADVVDQPAGLAWASLLLHLCGLVLVVAVLLLLLRPRRWLRLDLVSRVLVVGMLLDLAAYLIGQQATDLTSARYLLPFLGFGAVLAGREGVPRLLARRQRLSLALLVVSAAYAGVFAAGAVTAQPAPPPLQPVTSWLAEHGATHGLGTYWDANVVTLSTRGAIAVRAVERTPDAVTPFLWHATVSWYGAGNRATFVLLDRTDTADRKAIERALGTPSEIATVGDTTILLWPGNVMGSLSPP